MTKPVARTGLPVIQGAQARLYVFKAGSALLGALEQLYAAHMEKVQMRLAPTKADRPRQHLSESRRY